MELGEGDATVVPGEDRAHLRVEGHVLQVVCSLCGKVVYEALFRAGEYGGAFVPADGSDADELCRAHARTCSHERAPFERFASAEGIPLDGGGMYCPGCGALLASHGAAVCDRCASV